MILKIVSVWGAGGGRGPCDGKMCVEFEDKWNWKQMTFPSPFVLNMLCTLPRIIYFLGLSDCFTFPPLFF